MSSIWHSPRLAAASALVTSIALTPFAASAADCPGGVKTSGALGQVCVGDGNTNPIFSLVSLFLTFFTGIFGLILVLVIVISGIQYITSAGSSDGTKEAKDRLKAAITGLVLFVLMYGILQFILPSAEGLFR